MIYRIIFYLIGLLLSSFGLSLMIINLSFYNINYSFSEKFILFFKSPALYLFLLGLTVCLKALFYDLKSKN